MSRILSQVMLVSINILTLADLGKIADPLVLCECPSIIMKKHRQLGAAFLKPDAMQETQIEAVLCFATCFPNYFIISSPLSLLVLLYS